EFTPETPLAAGAGVVFETGINPDDEQGGRIYEVRGERFYFRRGQIDFRRLAPGHRVWKNSDPALERELRRTFARELPVPARSLTFHVHGRAGGPLYVEARCGALRHTVASR